MAIGAVGGAGIRHEGNEIVEIARVADCALDARVRHYPGDDQQSYAEIAQYVIDIGRDEDAARRLSEDHLVVGRSDFVDHLGILGSAVRRSPRSCSRGCCRGRRASCSRSLSRRPRCRRYGRRTAGAGYWAIRRPADSAENIRSSRPSHRCNSSAHRCSTMPRGPDRWHLAAQSVHRRKNSLYAAGSKRAKRSAQAF